MSLLITEQFFIPQQVNILIINQRIVQFRHLTTIKVAFHSILRPQIAVPLIIEPNIPKMTIKSIRILVTLPQLEYQFIERMTMSFILKFYSLTSSTSSKFHISEQFLRSFTVSIIKEIPRRIKVLRVFKIHIFYCIPVVLSFVICCEMEFRVSFEGREPYRLFSGIGLYVFISGFRKRS